ncbi:major facilitator superfamily domain-containing protein [Truncatella angustata]|uniref:Major facilitator superfamily domain-containing protein n=1 Tax=Truncatella angustata TaxID=152316 RepID=A0A9P9A2C3_9PEZI|nr:major facilitator superfamily domain-containing protein [Truncatella angustata]KAH6659237.1 major facilitator superfamily domain-containing protein [Truncatella angustata]
MTSERQPGKAGGKITMVDAEEIRSHSGETSPLLGAGAGSEDGGRRSSQEWDGGEDFKHLPAWRRPSVLWLIGPYFLFTLAFGGVIVPKLNLIVDLVCKNYFADESLKDPAFIFTPVVLGGENPQCKIPKVQKNVSIFTLTLSVLTGLLSALTAPKLGSLSDRYGRTRLITVASCGGIINEIITILAAKYPNYIDYHWLILGSFFDGITGSFTAGSILSSSYTSDCSPPSRRGVAIGYLHACLFTGLAFGPLLAGYFVKYTGSLLSIFYVTLGCHIVFIFFILLVTPESLSKKRQMLAREKHQNEQEVLAERLRVRLGNMGPKMASLLSDSLGDWLPALVSANPLAPLKSLLPGGQANRSFRRNMIILACLDAVILSAAMGSGTVTILYVEYMFNWGNFEASRFVSLISFIRVIVLLGVFPLVNWVFRIRPLRQQRRASGLSVPEKNNGADKVDIWMLRVAIASDLIGILGYVFARSDVLFVFCGVITAFGGLGGAVVQSTITKHVPAHRVGALLGAIGLLHGIGRVVAPLVFNGLYAATIETYPQAFLVLLATLFGLAFIGSIFVKPRRKSSA